MKNPSQKLRFLLLALALRPAIAFGGDNWIGPPEQSRLEVIQSSAAALGGQTSKALAVRRRLFADYFKQNPPGVWSARLSSTTRQALDDYGSSRRLPSGLVYGQSVKDLDLRGKTAAEIDSLLLAKGFEKHEDWIRDPKTQKPVRDAQGGALPMTIYVHADGGMVRVKPKGDSTSKFRPQPHAVKAVRFPCDADYENFNYEAFKVDNNGNAVPKAPGDLNNPYEGTPMKFLFMDSWGDSVHTDLKDERQTFYKVRPGAFYADLPEMLDAIA